MTLPEFPLYFMETLKCWRSLHGYIVLLMFLTKASKGSACEAPSSPQCFKRKTHDNRYFCEWSMNTTERDVTYDLYLNKTKFWNIKNTSYELKKEQLVRTHLEVHICVEAHVGNSRCTSASRSVVLKHTVKFQVPQNIGMSWFKNNLSLRWTKAEEYPALAEVQFHRVDQPKTVSWENRVTNTTIDHFQYQVFVLNLLKHKAYQVQIRHQSNQVPHPLWSDWSPIVIVPAELEHKPEVSMTTTLMNGMRKVTLTWKPDTHAAATGVNYNVMDISTSCRNPCESRKHNTSLKEYPIYISYSAANISVVAVNAAGNSPPAIIQIPVEFPAVLKPCDKTPLGEKLKKRTCLEFYEFQGGDLRPENVIVLTARGRSKEKNEIKKSVKAFIRYLYFEHKCVGEKPQTVNTCLFYKKEGVPLRKPEHLYSSDDTHGSVNLSWKAIPIADLQGFQTHYSLCSVKISSQDEPKECYNISSSLLNHRLENLTPGANYNISLAVVTGEGEGPRAILFINKNKLPKNSLNVLLIILSLMFVLFLFSTTCICIMKRIKKKLLPSVPTPVITNFNFPQLENELTLERKEEVDKLTLHQLHPNRKSVLESAEQTTIFEGEWDDGSEEDMENGKIKIKGEMTDLELADNEIAMLIYRNGLVFDLKTDSS